MNLTKSILFVFGALALSACNFEHSTCSYSLSVNATSSYTGNASIIKGDLYRALESRGYDYDKEGDIEINVTTSSSNDRVDSYLCKVTYSVVDYADLEDGIALAQGQKKFSIRERLDASKNWLELSEMEADCTKKIGSHLKSIVKKVGSCQVSES